MKNFKSVLSWLIPIAVGLIAAFLINMFVYVGVTVSGDSMLETLKDRERVSVIKTATIHRGSVVAFDARDEDPGIQPGQKYYIKRVVGVAGDTVESKDGVIYVNEKKINQTYLSNYNLKSGTGTWTLETLSSGDSEFKTNISYWADGKATKVPAGQYFVLGDNRSESEDSRYFGFVEKQHMLGVAFVNVWDSGRNNVNLAWKDFFN